MSRRIWSFAFAVVLCPAAAWGQRIHPLVGHHTRVAYRCGERGPRQGLCRAEGLVRSTGGDSLRIAVAGDTGWAVAKTAVERVWVRNRRPSRLLAGAGLGLLAGTLAGAAIGATQEICLFQCSSAAPLGALVGAPTGMVIGGVVGAFLGRDGWRRVHGDGIAVRMRGAGAGMGVGLAVAF